MMRRSLRVLCTAATLAAAALPAPAWAVYKVVGPDGSVTFTDQPPATRPATRLDLGGPRAATLPPELARVVARYPVTLYTTSDCSACDEARGLLLHRGVPFTERTVTTERDLAAYQRIAGKTRSAPLLTIGSTRLPVGFQSSGWTAALDAAGYPRTSLLPQGWPHPAATPLTSPDNAPGAAARAPQASAPAEPSVVPPPNPNAPPGFRF